MALDDYLRQAIDLQLRTAPQSVSQFVEGLATFGIRTFVALKRNGHLSGFRFGRDDRSFKGSELGYDYTLAGLLARGLEYRLLDMAELQAKAITVSEPPSAHVEEHEWPDYIAPASRQASNQPKVNREELRRFVRAEGLLFWRHGVDSVVFYHRSPTEKGARKGIAFIDCGNKLDIRISGDGNILKALMFGVIKWGAVRVAGSRQFIARTKTLAEAKGITLAASSPKIISEF